jgi:hypothetical protein
MNQNEAKQSSFDRQLTANAQLFVLAMMIRFSTQNSNTAAAADAALQGLCSMCCTSSKSIKIKV